MRNSKAGGLIIAIISVMACAASEADSTSEDIQEIAADVKVNGDDGPVTIAEGESFNYGWSSENAASCEISDGSEFTSGISLSGNGGPVDPEHAFYPSAQLPTVLKLTCSRGTTTVTDSVIIRLAQ